VDVEFHCFSFLSGCLTSSCCVLVLYIRRFCWCLMMGLWAHLKREETGDGKAWPWSRVVNCCLHYTMTWLFQCGFPNASVLRLAYLEFVLHWSASQRRLSQVLPRKETWPQDRLERTGESLTSLCIYPRGTLHSTCPHAWCLPLLGNRPLRFCGRMCGSSFFYSVINQVWLYFILSLLPEVTDPSIHFVSHIASLPSLTSCQRMHVLVRFLSMWANTWVKVLHGGRTYFNS
jgi:hypothetical protein